MVKIVTQANENKLRAQKEYTVKIIMQANEKWTIDTLFTQGVCIETGTSNSCKVSQSRVSSLTPSQSLIETLSVSQRASVPTQVPAMFIIVLRSVMYVPPMTGSLILAWNAIPDTNIE